MKGSDNATGSPRPLADGEVHAFRFVHDTLAEQPDARPRIEIVPFTDFVMDPELGAGRFVARFNVTIEVCR